MENKKILRLYSNNSKKSRLKRRKNKFQRVWNIEKQTYIKVRKPNNGPHKFSRKEMKERFGTVNESVPVTVKTEIQKPEKKAVKQIKTHARKDGWDKPHVYSIHKRNYIWDNETLRYKLTAQ